MSGWRWYCMECHADLGPVVGKHKGTCPRCGSKSAYATPRGSDVQPKLVKEQGRRANEQELYG